MKKLTVCLSLLLSIGLWGPAPVSAGECGCGSECVNDPCPCGCEMSPPECQWEPGCPGAPTCTTGDCPTGMNICTGCLLCWCGGFTCPITGCTCNDLVQCVCGGDGCASVSSCQEVCPTGGGQQPTPCGGTKACTCSYQCSNNGCPPLCSDNYTLPCTQDVMGCCSDNACQCCQASECRYGPGGECTACGSLCNCDSCASSNCF